MSIQDLPPSSAYISEEAVPSQISSTDSLDQIKEILKKADFNTLVLFDVDSTLILPNDTILRPQNDQQFTDLLGGRKVVALGDGMRYLFREILLKAPHSLVDSRSVELIKELEQRGVPVIAFTATPRGKVGEIESVADARIKELSQFGFDFHLFADQGTIDLGDPEDLGGFSPIFQEGVLFASLHPKGDTLRDFLQKINYRPTRVILIDDQMNQIESVGKALENLGIPYTGIRYTAAENLAAPLDQMTPEFRQTIAEFQVSHFLQEGEWISDAEASVRVLQKPVSQEKPVEKIYIDFGGVTAESNPQRQLEWLVNFGFPQEKIESSPYFQWMQLHPEEIAYLTQIGSELNIPFNVAALKDYEEIKSGSICEVPGMRALIEELRERGYEVNLITNIREENLSLIEPFQAMFDRVVHCPKDPGERQESWEIECSHSGLKTSQLLLIDDQEKNTKEAEQLGLLTIDFKDAETLRAQLIDLKIL